MTAVENYRYSFEFINTGIKTECGDGENLDFVCDPIEIHGNIQIKEEVDVKWEEYSVDENHDNSSDKVNDTTIDITNTSDNVPHCTINYDLLAESITGGPQTKSSYSISIELCEKYQIGQSWLEHSYCRIVHPEGENCRYKVSNKAKEGTTTADKLNSNPGLITEKPNCTKYQCDFCVYQSFQKSNIQAHIFNEHLSKRVCQNCNKIFPNVSSIYLHLYECSLFKCNNCSYKTNKRQHIQQHIFNVHMDKSGKKISKDLKNQIFRFCPNCNKVYSSSTIKFHMISCPKKKLRYKYCNFCSFKTLRIYILEKHLLTEHPKENETSQICEKCGTIIDNQLPTRSHYFECPLTPFIKCNHCTFITKYNLCLIKHLLRRHCNLGQKSYECPKCSQKLIFASDFQKHLFDCFRSCYMQCDVCSYKTSMPSNLTEHVLNRHYRRQEYCLIPCTKCGCRLDTYISWRDHMSKCEKTE